MRKDRGRNLEATMGEAAASHPTRGHRALLPSRGLIPALALVLALLGFVAIFLFLFLLSQQDDGGIASPTPTPCRWPSHVSHGESVRAADGAFTRPPPRSENGLVVLTAIASSSCSLPRPPTYSCRRQHQQRREDGRDRSGSDSGYAGRLRRKTTGPCSKQPSSIIVGWPGQRRPTPTPASTPPTLPPRPRRCHGGGGRVSRSTTFHRLRYSGKHVAALFAVVPSASKRRVYGRRPHAQPSCTRFVSPASLVFSDLSCGPAALADAPGNDERVQRGWFTKATRFVISLPSLLRRRRTVLFSLLPSLLWRFQTLI